MTKIKPIQVKDEMGPEAKEGIEIHERLEKRLLSGVPLQGTMAKYEGYCKAIEAAPGNLHPEAGMTLNRQMAPTGWFDSDAWLRVKIDALKINGTKAWIGDWKTGKVKNEYDQLELCAAVVFSYYSEVQEIMANYIWLNDMKLSDPQIYRRENVREIWAKHLPDVLKLEKAVGTGDFPTKTNGLCRNYCPVKKVGKCPEFKE